MSKIKGLCAMYTVAMTGFAQQPFAPTKIHRLDGSTISTTDAEVFARTTLDNAHVKGAQLVVVDRGRLV